MFIALYKYLQQLYLQSVCEMRAGMFSRVCWLFMQQMCYYVGRGDGSPS